MQNNTFYAIVDQKNDLVVINHDGDYRRMNTNYPVQSLPADARYACIGYIDNIPCLYLFSDGYVYEWTGIDWERSSNDSIPASQTLNSSEIPWDIHHFKFSTFQGNTVYIVSASGDLIIYDMATQTWKSHLPAPYDVDVGVQVTESGRVLVYGSGHIMQYNGSTWLCTPSESVPILNAQQQLHGSLSLTKHGISWAFDNRRRGLPWDARSKDVLCTLLLCVQLPPELERAVIDEFPSPIVG